MAHQVRPGIEFHNGKTLTIDDVIYSLKRTKNLKLKLFGNASFASIDLKRTKKLDKRTCRIFLTQGDVTMIEAFAQYFQGIVPSGTRRLASQGAAEVHRDRAVQGEELHARARERARQERELLAHGPAVLRRGAHHQLPVRRGEGQRAPLGADRGNVRRPVRADTGHQGPQEPAHLHRQDRRLDADLHAGRRRPFDDVRVRRAFRLLINRPQAVQQGLSGYGIVGNDIYSPYDPLYAADDFPQRKYDPEQAKSLLKAAGQEGLKVELASTAWDTGMNEGATIFAQNAKAGGVDVDLKILDGTAFNDQYLKWPFSTDYWGTRNYLLQTASAVLKTAPFNEIHWDAYPSYARFASLYKQAIGTVDEKKRGDIIAEMQRMQYNDGGHIIWGFKNLTDAYSAKVGGYKPEKGATLNLNKYGNGFRTIYLIGSGCRAEARHPPRFRLSEEGPFHMRIRRATSEDVAAIRAIVEAAYAMYSRASGAHPRRSRRTTRRWSMPAKHGSASRTSRWSGCSCFGPATML